MTDTPSPKPANLAADEKLTPVMIYTINSLVRASVITKENIRVSIWLRMAGAPEFIHLIERQCLNLRHILAITEFQRLFPFHPTGAGVSPAPACG